MATRDPSIRARHTTRELTRNASLPMMDTNASSAQHKKTQKVSHTVGMLKGVLVPTCENMWGVLIFLRFYHIVGYAGSDTRSSS